ncbi:MAG: hypothetical protein EOO50_15715 [Flavobacterium sp.]|uniref:hypothetical protein n=1 Tax=Flavobacterium sp. TaxID=239 RepID=UPI001221168B|nr:hypothetical protein [Flavobacterium sp.]RZJ64403.1 MAG: hypothetical protein EOO50_15715 [Flavobacterium sp.]
MQSTRMPADGGMLYTETNLDRLFPEPLNAITSLFFLVIAAYWLWKLRGEYREHSYLTLCVFLLLVGAIGGSIYHGLRQWRIFIMMDWLPIMLICVFTGVYFVAKLTRWYVAAGVVLLYGLFQFFVRQQMRKGDNVQLFINVNYAVLGMLVLFPVLAFLWKNKFANGKWVAYAWFAFMAALTFRIADGFYWLPFGTHFLWHTFGAVAAFCMLEFVYQVNKTRPDFAPER